MQVRTRFGIVCLCLAGLCAAAAAQAVLIDEEFSADPSGTWQLNGGATWDAAGGRVVLTPAGGGPPASMFFKTPIGVSDITLLARVKTCCGSGADGMTITFIDDESAMTNVGGGGSGLGLADLAPGGQIAVEFDIYGGNCEQCPSDGGGGEEGNHIGVEYSATGFPGGDNFLCPVNAANIACASNGALGFDLYGDHFVDVVVRIQGASIAIDAGCPDCVPPVAVHRVIDHAFADYSPLEGLVGFTAGTGGATAEQSVYSIKVLSAAAGTCLTTPVKATRSIAVNSQITVEGTPVTAYVADSDLNVTLALSEIRQASETCPAAGTVRIVESLPAGWSASAITAGGALAGGSITWNLTAAQLSSTSELRYTARGPVAGSSMAIAGTITEAGNPVPFSVFGQGAFPADTGMEAAGFITKWLTLGPFKQDGGAAPGESAMRRDYLTDGLDIAEDTVRPAAGDTVATDFGNAAASTGLGSTPPGVNPAGIPEWLEWRDADYKINFQSSGLYGDNDDVMAYAVCYLSVAATMDVTVACGSDDSIQILIDETEVWIKSEPRGWGGPDPDDVSQPFTLTAGSHRLMVKVFEGGGDWVFGARFQTPQGAPVTRGIGVSLEPPGLCVPVRTSRTLALGSTVNLEGTEVPVYKEGDVLPVTIGLRDVRPAGGTCPALGTVTITETLPEGWTASDVTSPGTTAGNTVRWVLPSAQVTEGKTLSYKAFGPVVSSTMRIAGTVVEQGNPSTFAVGGTGSFLSDQGLLANGTIVAWLLLGPFDNDRGLATQLDYLTDGADDETTVIPAAGDEVAPDYGGASAATGLARVANPGINPRAAEGIATWFAWRDVDGDPVDLGAASLFGGVDDVVCYAACYLCVESDITAVFACGSDDAIKIMLDGNEVWNNPATRPYGSFSDLPPPVALAAGGHTLLVKIFDGCCDWRFGIRLQDETGSPIAGGVTVSLDPGSCGGQPLPRPAAPKNLQATAGDATVSLDWADNTEPDLASYRVYRSTTSGTGYALRASSVPASAFVDDDVTNDTTYHYVVTAVNAAGRESTRSTQASATPKAGGAVINVFTGDVNGSKRVDIADAISLLGYLFGKQTPPPCAKAADANDDDGLNIADAISVLGYLFSRGSLRAPDGTWFTASEPRTCVGYAASVIPVRMGLLPGCATPCAP